MSASDYREVTACRLCDSPDLTAALKLPDTPLANELGGTELFPLQVNRCNTCGHHQLSIAVAAERLWGQNYPYKSGVSPVFVRHLEALADEVAALKPGGRVLEIASNDGTLVDALTKRGVVAMGVDPSGPNDDARMLWRLSWPPPKAWASNAGFDAILALNVFAHVDDLHGFTSAVKEALAPDGVFILEVGDFVKVCGFGMFDTVYHEHFSYHHVTPLLAFFERHGLQVTEIENVASQGGSIRLYVKHSGMPPLTVFEDEPNTAKLARRIEQRGEALREASRKLFKRDETVAIYGAPAKLTTFLYGLGLERMPFACVGDDNPLKVGKRTPGGHLPIVSVDEMLAMKPDTILVAAWNFAADITRKLREAGYKGGIIDPMGTR